MESVSPLSCHGVSVPIRLGCHGVSVPIGLGESVSPLGCHGVSVPIRLSWSQCPHWVVMESVSPLGWVSQCPH